MSVGAGVPRATTAHLTNDFGLFTSFGCARREKVADFTSEDVYYDLQLSWLECIQ